MYDWLDEAIDSRAIILTSSRRLARDLRAVYERRRLAAGDRAWRTPDIVSLDGWLARVLAAAELDDAPLVLPPAAATLLWERCLERTSPGDVLSTAAIVRHARQAWQRLHEWGVSLDQLDAAGGNADQRWFARAARAFDRRLRSGHWLDAAELPAGIARRLAAGNVEPPERMIHAGFERIVPAVRQLFDALAGCGVALDAAPVPAAATRPRTVCHHDAAAQWRAAGAYARRVLACEPQARVAILAPDLAADAPAVARLVREGLAPGWQVAGGRHRAAVDVSYGRRLADFPVIATALLCLEWAHRGLAGRDISVLLRSPFTGTDEPDGRCRLERHLRRLPDRRFAVDEFLAACRDRRVAGEARAWRRRIAAIGELAAHDSARATPAAWARRFDAALTALGWPAIDAPDSEEFQLLNRWRQLLNELARTGIVRPGMRLGEAVRRLARIAADTVYQPESRPGAVQLSGMPEATGMEFDHLWIGGLDAAHWPPPSRPLPLLPGRLQRAFEMPDATPDDTLRYAREALERRLASAGAATLAWPRAEQDAMLAPSPLLGGAATADAIPADDDPGWFAATLAGEEPLERLVDDEGPPVTAGERLRGGAYAVQLQHEDPFSGFAKARLGVDELEPFETGLSARLRGSLLHRALRKLLADTPTRATIAGWRGGELTARIGRAVNEALYPFRRHADPVLERLLDIEARRTAGLLRDFVAAEARRDDFAVVAVECEIELAHGPLTLRLRIDRIDRLADGSQLVIDYKSGRERRLIDRRGRLRDLQLGVYARALGGRIGGLLLLSLDSRAIAYRGEGAAVPWGRLPAADWPELLGEWLSQVDGVLSRMAAGDLRLNRQLPEDRARPLKLLSRIEELRRAP